MFHLACIEECSAKAGRAGARRKGGGGGVPQLSHDGVGLREGELRGEEGRGDAEGVHKGHHLILDQGQQRRHHHRYPRAQDGGQLPQRVTSRKGRRSLCQQEKTEKRQTACIAALHEIRKEDPRAANSALVVRDAQ